MIRTKTAAALLRLDRAVVFVCRWSVIGCFVGLFLLLSLGIVQRMVPVIKLAGHDELIELLFIWMTFIAAVALWREGALYRVEAIDHLLGPRARRALAMLIHIVMLLLALMLTAKGWEFMQVSGETTPFLHMDKMYWYAAIPFCSALMSVYSVAGMWRTVHGGTNENHEIITLG